MSFPSPRIASGALALIAATLAASCMAPTDSPKRTPVSLAQMFSDHAVLQADLPVPVWGTAGAGDAVAVSFQGQTVRTVAGADGRWSVKLSPVKATAAASDLVASGATTAVAHDVVVGEVWLCSGQSNMEFTVDDGGPVYRVQNAEAEVAAADYPMIRQFKVEQAVAQAPASAVTTSGWVPASPKTVGHFTAVGFFFARDIHRTLGVPVGIILSSWGGTPIESWLSDPARASTSIAATLAERWTKSKGEWPPERVARYPVDREAWARAEADAHANHTKNPLPWPQPPSTEDSPMRPGGLYNAMIAPLRPYGLRGFLWYQGEANVSRADEYTELLKTLITSWRADWGEGSTPFYIVQLANWSSDGEADHRDWAALREAQERATTLPDTGMAVTIDIGDAHNIHPANKQEVGRRLALLAKARVYGVPPEVTGPVFAGAAREGAALRVRFTHAGELVTRGGPVGALEIAGADRVFHPASAAIEVDTLLVSSPDVPEPVAVRYAWTNSPVANLYSETGLPAAPFRSDNW